MMFRKASRQVAAGLRLVSKKKYQGVALATREATSPGQCRPVRNDDNAPPGDEGLDTEHSRHAARSGPHLGLAAYTGLSPMIVARIILRTAG
jgi:hypothetical protein